jgi:hypothetical protein
MTDIARHNSLLRLLADTRRITPEDVLHLRRTVFGDGFVSRADADAIFAMDHAPVEKCREWVTFFVEAITDHIIHQVQPLGYISVENAEWLIDKIGHDGHLESLGEIELLVRVMAKAKYVPDILSAFVFAEIARAVVEGEGPLARHGKLTRGMIGEAEVELIREVLFAYGSERNIAVSRFEAEMLFDLNDRTAAAENHPAWRELFVKSVANYLMSEASYNVPSRAEAIAREAWLEDRSVDIAGSLRGIFSSFGELFTPSFYDCLFEDAHCQMEKAWAARNARVNARLDEAAAITDTEGEWLIERLCADGLITQNEVALLDFIRRQGNGFHPDLAAELERSVATA